MMKTLNRIPGAVIVWVTSFVFFLLTLVNNFSASHDSINYLYHITKGEHLFHQHHLLYHFLANKWLGFWGNFFECEGVSAHLRLASMGEGGLLYCREHYLVESFTAFWGSCVLTIVYLFFRNRFFLTRSACLLGTAVIAFSYGTWFYSTNVEVYMPPIFFILWCLYILTSKDFGRSDIWKIAVLHSIAILFHQVNVLFVVVVLSVIISHKIYSSVFKYGLIGLLITGGVYFIVGWFVEGHNNINDLVHWMRGYTAGHDYWKPLSLRTPIDVLTGFGHAFIGGHFIFQLPLLKSQLQNSFQSHGLRDEIFLSANISSVTAWVLLIASVILVVILLVLSIKFIAKIRTMKLHYYAITPLITCIITYSLFFCFWMPEILEFWILQMILVWILLIGMLPLIRFPFHLKINPGLVITALLLFSVNFFGSMRWLKDINRDWYFTETKRIAETLQPGQPVELKKDQWMIRDYLLYFTRANIIIIP